MRRRPKKCREFVQVAELLEAASVHVPKILETDFDAGFMLVTDLGTTTYMSVLDEKNARPLMRAAIDTLIRFQQTAREGVLPPFDEAFLRREMELMPEWFIGRHLGREVTEEERKTLDDTFALLAESALAQPQTFMLRDYMPRNLMVSEPNPGVLDFQDAVYGPITYDMASLVRDAFISWDEEFQLDCIAYYWERAKKPGFPSIPISASSTASSNGWACSGTSRCWGFCAHPLSRRQAALPRGSAAFHRLRAQGRGALRPAVAVRAPARFARRPRDRSRLYVLGSRRCALSKRR